MTVTSANTTLHSGIYGGAAPNAAHAAAKIIASMYNDDGSVAVKDFSKDLIVPSKAQRAEIAAAEKDMQSTFDKEAFAIDQWVGEDGYTPLERTWVRNSLDVTGIKGGYTEGKASTIAYSTWFRVMSRVGPGQDPGTLNKLIIEHIKAHTPWGVKVEMTSATFGGAPFFDENERGFKIGHAVSNQVF